MTGHAHITHTAGLNPFRAEFGFIPLVTEKSQNKGERHDYCGAAAENKQFYVQQSLAHPHFCDCDACLNGERDA